jgi:hypothetical protein
VSSEVPGFITRYLATVAKGLGIAITFSAHQSKFKYYSADFYRMIKSIRVRENIPLPKEPVAFGKENLGPGVILGKLGSDKRKSKAGKKGGKQIADIGVTQGGGEGSGDTMLIIGVIAAIIILLIIIRRRKTKY